MIPIEYYSALKNEILDSIVMGSTQAVKASGSGAERLIRGNVIANFLA